MSGRPFRLAVADSPRAPFDDRLLRRLEERGRVKAQLFREPEFSGTAGGSFDALFVPEIMSGPLRQLLRRARRHLPILLGDAAPLPRFRRGLLRNAALHFYGSDAAREERIRAGIEPERLHFLPPHPLEFETTAERRKNEERARALRSALGIPDSERVLLFAGEFTRENAPGILLESFFLRLRECGLSGWTLALAGSGPLEGQLRALAGASARVRFLPDSEPPAVLRRAGDLIALPSKSQRTGARAAAVAESMASGRPVLVTENAGAGLALVRPGKTGWSVDSAHPELWFDYIRPVSREQLRRMGEAARSAAEAWSFDTAAAAIEQATETIPDFFAENGG